MAAARAGSEAWRMPHLLHSLHHFSKPLASWSCQSQRRRPSHAISRTDRALEIEMTARRRFSGWRWRRAQRKDRRRYPPWALASEMGSGVELKLVACPAAWVGCPESQSHAVVAVRIRLRQQQRRVLAEAPPEAVLPISTCLCKSRYRVSGNSSQVVCEGRPYIFNGNLAALHGTGSL